MLKTIFGEANIRNASKLTGLDLPVLEAVEGDFVLSYIGQRELTLPALKSARALSDRHLPGDAIGKPAGAHQLSDR